MREGFAATAADPQFLPFANEPKLEIHPRSGAAVQAAADAVARIPRAIRAHTASIVGG